MNKKLITAAVASALAVPAVASAADSEVSVYGRINNALQYSDLDGGSSAWGLRNVVSRLGIRASSDLGNGLTAIGRYEFFTYTNREGDFDSVGGKGRGGINDTRLGYVGLSGAWGSVTVGNQWSSFYDTVGTHLDPTYSLGYFLYSSTVGGPYRTSNTIKYANSFGPVYVELDLRLSHNASAVPGGSGNADEEVLGRDRCGASGAPAGCEDVDGFGLGASWAINDNFTLAAAIDKDKAPTGTANDIDRFGIAGKFTSGAWWISLGYQKLDVSVADTDQIQAWVGTSFGKTSVMLGYGRASFGGTGAPSGEPNQLTLGVYHNMGGGFRLYFEGMGFDDKNVAVGPNAGAAVGNTKTTVLLFGMRYDFST